MFHKNVNSYLKFKLIHKNEFMFCLFVFLFNFIHNRGLYLSNFFLIKLLKSIIIKCYLLLKAINLTLLYYQQVLCTPLRASIRFLSL